MEHFHFRWASIRSSRWFGYFFALVISICRSTDLRAHTRDHRTQVYSVFCFWFECKIIFEAADKQFSTWTLYMFRYKRDIMSYEQRTNADKFKSMKFHFQLRQTNFKANCLEQYTQISMSHRRWQYQWDLKKCFSWFFACLWIWLWKLCPTIHIECIEA